MSRLVQVPSGTIIDLDRIIFGLTSTDAIGQVGLLMAGNPTELMPNLEKSDVEALIKRGYIDQLQIVNLQ